MHKIPWEEDEYKKTQIIFVKSLSFLYCHALTPFTTVLHGRERSSVKFQTFIHLAKCALTKYQRQ